LLATIYPHSLTKPVYPLKELSRLLITDAIFNFRKINWFLQRIVVKQWLWLTLYEHHVTVITSIINMFKPFHPINPNRSAPRGTETSVYVIEIKQVHNSVPVYVEFLCWAGVW